MTRSLALVALAAALVGCDPPKRTSAPIDTGTPSKGPMTAGVPGRAGGPKAPAKDGKEAVQMRGCFRCHSIGETGGKKGKGPDLSHVGADPKHTKEWLIAYVKDPKATNPESQMPAHPAIPPAELEMIGEYLAGLK
ncbi:MAG TPA: c-type cytochrome [Gemmataceae bacterium]|nr:c-type cytochrome [Gemmataceae bacterium]